jgi:hypothetical protein
MDWAVVKTSFLARYPREADADEIRFEIMNEVAGFCQGPHETIQEYVYRAERLSKRIPQAENRNLAVMFIRGLKDDYDKKWVAVSVRSSKDFIIQGAHEHVEYPGSDSEDGMVVESQLGLNLPSRGK